MKRKSEVIGIMFLLILGIWPLIFPDSPTILRGRLISKGGRDSYNIRIEIYDISNNIELGKLHECRETDDLETFSSVFKSMFKGALRFIGESGIIVPIHAAAKRTIKSGLQFLLIAENQIAEPGVQKGLKQGRFLAIVLDLDNNLSGEGKIYEDAEVKFSERDIEIVSSLSIPRLIVNIKCENQQPEIRKAAPKSLKSETKRTTVLDQLVREAFMDMDSMNYEAAVKKLENIVALEPTQNELRNKLAYAHYRMHQYEKAILALSHEIEVHPDELQAYILLSFVQYKEGHLDEAEKAAIAFYERLQNYRKDEKSSPHTIEILLKGIFPNAGVPAYILGLQSRRKGEYQSAKDWFLKARELGYDKVDCWIQNIIIELKQENWLEILKLCQNGGDISGHNNSDSGTTDVEKSILFLQTKKDDIGIPAEIWLLEGIALEHLGKTAEALIAFETAEDRKPYDPDIIKHLAIRYSLDDKFERAIPLLRRAASLYPQDDQAQYLLNQAIHSSPSYKNIDNLGLSDGFLKGRDVRYRYVFDNEPKKVAEESNRYALGLIKEGKYEAGVRWLNSFAEIYGLSPTIHYNLGQLYNYLGRNAEALHYAMKTIEQKEDDKDAYDLAANVFFRIGDFDAAIQFYEKALRLDANDPLCYYNLGCAFFGRRDFDEAETNWRDAVRLDKTSHTANRRNITNSEVLKLEVNVEVEPVSAMAYRSLGYLDIMQGKTSEAVELFKKAIVSNPSHPMPYFEIGKLLLDQKDFNTARIYFNKYISRGGDEAKVRALIK